RRPVAPRAHRPPAAPPPAVRVAGPPGGRRRPPLRAVSPSTPDGYDRCNDYTRIIVDEALARGIRVTVLDPDIGELELTHDGRTHTVIQSLSDLTSAIAFRRCDDKALTRRVLVDAGLPVPPGRLATDDD